MSDKNATIFVENHPEFGPSIRCTDLEVADELDDFLAENELKQISARFSNTQVEFFVLGSTVSELIELLKKFDVSRC